LSNPGLVEFIVASDALDMLLPDDKEIIRIPADELKKLSATVSSQGILAVVKKPEFINGIPPKDPFIVVLDGVADPGNFGTIVRTVRAAGLKELWYTAGGVDPFNDKTIRAAMASQFVIGLRRFENMQELLGELYRYGYDRVYRTDVKTGRNCFLESELFDKSAIIIGGEAHGAGEAGDAISLTIPMPGDEESLNAAQAATIIIFEYVRRLTS
jgi:TrmH family RNA methyltransferase